MANRSRAECIAIIMRGESVLLEDGRNVSKIEDLPDAVSLAGDDIVAKQQALGELKEKADAAIAAYAAAIAETGGTPPPAGNDEEGEEEDDDEEPPPSPEQQFIAALSGYAVVGPDRAKALLAAGYDSRDKVLAADPKRLAKLPGFSAEDVTGLRNMLNPPQQ